MNSFDADDLKRRYLAGESVNHIAKTLDVTCKVVALRLSKIGVPLRGLRESRETAVDSGEILRRYSAGETANCIAESMGVTTKVITNRLRKAGAEIRDASQSRFANSGRQPPDPTEVVKLYESGESELAVSIRMGVSRPVIRRILLNNGIPIRGASEATTIHMARLGKEGRLRLTEAAHAAVRGVPQTEEYRQRVADGRQSRRVTISPLEDRFYVSLGGVGIEVIRQLAIGRYNVDLAIAESSIAVEILGGHFHASGLHAGRHRKRTDYILNRGWTPVFIWCTEDYPLAPGALDYVVALHKALCLEKPARREEHVIRGDGEGCAVGQGYPVGVPMIPCYKASYGPRRHHPRAGK